MKNKIFAFFFSLITSLSLSSFLPLQAETGISVTLPNNNIVSNANDYQIPIHVSNLDVSKLIMNVAIYKNDFLYKEEDIKVEENGYFPYVINTKKFKSSDKVKVHISYRYKNRDYITKTEFKILDGKSISTIKVSSPSVVDCIRGQEFYLPIKISYLDDKRKEVHKYEHDDISLQLSDNTSINKIIKLDRKAAASKIVLSNDKEGQYTVDIKPLNTNIKIESARIQLNISKQDKLKDVSIPNKDVTIDVGEIYTIVPKTTPQSYSLDGIHWMSSHPEIASVDSYGHVTGKKSGKTDITLTYKDIKRRIKINVKKRVHEIAFPEKKISIESGKSTALDYIIKPIDADISKINYETGDFMIAEVKDDRIIGNRVGTTHLTVTADNIVGKLEIEVIPALQVMNTNKDELSIAMNDSYQIIYDVSPSVYKQKVKLHYTSDDRKIAKVSTSGKITAISSGTTTINAYLDDEQSFKITIKVLSGEDEFKIKANTLNLKSGDTIDIKDFIENTFDLKKLKISCDCKGVDIDGTKIKTTQEGECPLILNYRETTKILNLKIKDSQNMGDSNTDQNGTRNKDIVKNKTEYKSDNFLKILSIGAIAICSILLIFFKKNHNR